MALPIRTEGTPRATADVDRHSESEESDGSDIEMLDAEPPRGRKRPKPDTQKKRKPPKLDMDKPFEGKSVQEKRTFDVRLRVHFQANEWYYNGPDSDRRKILTVITAFGDSMLNKWDTLTAEGNAIDTMTWEDFDKFVLRTIRAPNWVQDDANQSYMNARQREHQTVTELNVGLRKNR
ncbi:hypothetical protein V1525DRAFT_390481 [Lipomyces kononenkoae]|uniref:Uncharacterized protein n=1 Tax=Lipomyces kononenkoae TaxID=34357 RepID=A0ACC3SVG1_LIPKO